VNRVAGQTGRKFTVIRSEGLAHVVGSASLDSE